VNACCTPQYSLCIQQGATFTKVFTWTTYTTGPSTAGTAPQPVDLTGWTAAMQIRAYPGASSVLYDASSDITLGGDAGTISLTIPASATEGFTFWSAVYDLLLTDPSGNVTRFIGGSVTVSPGVTT
jgi:hypothetical protein